MRATACLGLVLVALGCRPSTAQPQPASRDGGTATSGRAPGKRTQPAPDIDLVIFKGGLQNGWQDYGWAKRSLTDAGVERLDFTNYAGWILARPELTGTYGGLVLRYRAPADWGDFLQVRLDSERADVFPRLKPGPEARRDLPDGTVELYLPMHELNPSFAPFDHVVLRAYRPVPGPGDLELVELGLSLADEHTREASLAAERAPARAVTLEVDCAAPAPPISPLVYGIAYSAMHEYRQDHQWKLNATARRWGGNTTSRYNWELGNAWNSGSDWFFRNIDYTGKPGFAWERFLSSNAQHGMASALTVPTLGWVARDTSSFSFPVEEFGAQQQTDPEVKSAGNGKNRLGKPIDPGPPKRTSVEATPDFVGRWVKALRAREGGQGKGADLYILDNEPSLWNDTHRDVHPQPVSYDELLKRTLDYGAAVKAADPQAQVAGPADWGWPAYFYSAVDAKAGFPLRPDRRAHGDVPLVPWLLKQVTEHQKKTGVRVLDVLDLHFYPQGKNIGVGVQGGTDEDTVARRLRSTRALWDPSYVDESWIAEPIQLIPRMKGWVADNAPGLKTAIGEYNFGAERHLSGGLALAEALGRFGQHGLDAAFYWTYPAEDSPAFWAFRAYRNYDGQGGRFLDYSLPTTDSREVSLFASRDADSNRVTLVALNLSGGERTDATVLLKGCRPVAGQRVFSYAGEPAGLTERPQEKNQRVYRLAPWSITVVDLALVPARPGPKASTP